MDLLTPAEAAEYAGVSERSLRAWARDGRLTRYTGPDGRTRYSRVELTALRGDVPEALGATDEDSAAENGAHPDNGARLDSGIHPEEPAPARPASDSGTATFLLARLQELERAVKAERDRVEEAQRDLNRERERAANLQAEVARLRATLYERERRETERGEEVTFLRTQLSARTEAEEQLRVLLQGEQRTLVSLNERLEEIERRALPAPAPPGAAPAAPAPPQRRWWPFGRRDE